MADVGAPAPADVVVTELAHLRRARGLRRSHLAPYVGPELRALIDVSPEADDDVLRQPLADALMRAAATLDEDLQIPFLYAFAVRSDLRLLQDRLLKAGEAIDRHPRTVRRRVEEAEVKVADHLRAAQRRRNAHAMAPAGWSVNSMVSELDLRAARPRMTAEKTVLVSRPLRDLTESFFLSGPVPEKTDESAVTIEVVGGGTLVAIERDAARNWRYRVRLPRPLEPGECHTFVVSVSVPSLANTAPFNAVAPLRECQDFRCVVHFSADRLPSRVQRIDGLPTSVFNDEIGHTNLVPVGSTVDDRFWHLTPGLAYGLRWAF